MIDQMGDIENGLRLWKIGNIENGPPVLLVEEKDTGNVYSETLENVPFPLDVPPAAYTLFTVRYTPTTVLEAATLWFSSLLRIFLMSN